MLLKLSRLFNIFGKVSAELTSCEKLAAEYRSVQLECQNAEARLEKEIDRLNPIDSFEKVQQEIEELTICLNQNQTILSTSSGQRKALAEKMNETKQCLQKLQEQKLYLSKGISLISERQRKTNIYSDDKLRMYTNVIIICI